MSKQHWPSWWYGPDGKGAVFASEADVPKGWKDHPSKHAPQDPKPAAETTPPAKTNSRAPAKKAGAKKAGRKPAAEKPAAPLDL